jgi:hypothetical protein
VAHLPAGLQLLHGPGIGTASILGVDEALKPIPVTHPGRISRCSEHTATVAGKIKPPAATARGDDLALDLVDSRTFDGRFQLLEYVPTVLDGPPGGGSTAAPPP